ncbi:hypothetical protein AAG747_28860 [Rapidithrix thailandica]|uniref:Leucine-rich repeat domain-containing protein n=1 Tax=Rapidithrix thailandica TaxID=413964 RepID=A0AAW9SJK3_9BACT
MNLDKKDLVYFKQNSQSLKETLVVSIERGAFKNVLLELNDYLKTSQEIKLVLVCDPTKTSEGEIICNLEVLKYLGNLQKIDILVNSSMPLESISELEVVKDLKSLKISGFYNKKINLSTLKRFKNIKELSLENGLSKKDYFLLNSKLKVLEVRELNIDYVERNENLEELTIFHKLSGEKKLVEKFPNLKSLKLKNCNQIEDFAFISPLNSLENLSFNSVRNLKFVPKLSSNTIKRLEILNCKNLNSIKTISSFSLLERLAITDANIDFQEIQDISEDLRLEIFYFRSKGNKENDIFEALSQKNGFQNTHRGFWR